MLLARPFSVRVAGHSSAPCPTLVCRKQRDTIVSEVQQIVERMSGLSPGWMGRAVAPGSSSRRQGIRLPLVLKGNLFSAHDGR